MGSMTYLRKSDWVDLEGHIYRHHEECQRPPWVMIPQSLSDVLDSYQVDAWAVESHKPGFQRVWVRTQDEVVIGHVVVTGYPLPSMSHRCTLGMGVEAAHRGKGIGRQLMTQALRWARSQSHLRYVDGYAISTNAPVIALDLSVGFIGAGSIVDVARAPDGTQLDQLILTLPLRQS